LKQAKSVFSKKALQAYQAEKLEFPGSRSQISLEFCSSEEMLPPSSPYLLNF